MPEIKQLFDNNSKWSEEIRSERPEYFAKLEEGQTLDSFGLAAPIAEYQQSV